MRLSSIFSILIVTILLNGCEVSDSERRDRSNDNDTENQSWVRLERGTDHSGILVEVLEHAAYAKTDENGHFYFEGLPNGNFTVAAEMPYHEFYQSRERGVRFRDGRPDSPLEVNLAQQVSFIAELPETTINLRDQHPNEPFSLPPHELIVTNLTDDYVTLQSNRGQMVLYAFVPVSGSWPDFEDTGIPCELQYGTLGSDESGPAFAETLEPGKSSRLEVEPELFGQMLNAVCFSSGEYDVYIALSNQLVNSRFFNPDFPFDMDSQQGMDIYINPLSQSLIGKTSVIEPVRITIMK
ncbi:carboxypeptidase-like regulatory domain-containing protein [Balneolaceae bacterium ANBcel3]|nr:carboxypeptidase-like regulatory domain-containing protein [Balneolaceae bacterium ANBcel3]